jgi:hypothetical protein
MSRPNRVTIKQVIAMREAKAYGDWTYEQLAEKYGVSPSTVGRICTGQTYPDAPGPTVPKVVKYFGARCWRGHPLEPNRITIGRWTGCKLCKRIRTRDYMRRRRNSRLAAPTPTKLTSTMRRQAA